ncbi:hypothetical protein O59_001930 [Cellvibrio sp. BR]|nr:hypothetical protein O59_001930 [Cellvibrio sp. BR]
MCESQNASPCAGVFISIFRWFLDQPITATINKTPINQTSYQKVIFMTKDS